MKKILLSIVFLLSCFGTSAKASAENIILASWSKSNLNSIKPMAVQTGDPYWEAQGGTIPPGFTGASVNAIAVVGTDVYVGGDISSMSGNPTASHIAKWNGTSWEALGSGVDGVVRAITVSGSDVYVGGQFTTAGGISSPGIARWDGSAWHSVGGGLAVVGTPNVRAIAVSGSNIYAGGAFTDANGNTSADYIAMWDGASWNALGTGLNGTVNTIAIGNSNIYVGGFFTDAGSITTADRIAYWNGSSWNALSTGSTTTVNAIAFESDTSIYVGIAGAPGLRRWNGTAFSSVGGTNTLNNAVQSILLQGSNVIVGGSFTQNVNKSPLRLGRIAQWTGSAWQALDSLSGTVNALGYASSTLYIGGAFSDAGTMVNADRLAQWNGTRLLPVGTGLANTVRAIVASGTTVSVGGDFEDADTLTKADYAARWNGFTWSAMQSGFKGSVYSMSQSGTTIFAGGSFTQIGTGTKVNNVARWTGSTWGTMNVSGGTANTVGTNGSVNAVAAVTTTRAYVGGSFTKLGDSTVVNGIARWTNGVGWEALGSGVSGGNVYALALSGTKLYVGGDFTSAGGVANTSHIAVWDTATATWSALGSGISNNTVYSIVVNGSDVYVGGNFTDAGGVAAADHIAKWDGVSWSSVGTGTEINNTIRTMAFLGTDLYVGGDFTDAAGYSGGDYIAKWSGSAWSALGDGANNSVYAIIAAGSDLYAGGNFTSIDGSSASRFARYRVPDVTAPARPTAVVNATVSSQSMTIKWKKNTEVDFAKYRVYTGTDSNAVSQTDSSTSISDTSRVITGLTNGIKYYARISAVDIWGNQSNASVAISGTPNDTVPPSTPSLISATGDNLTVNLTWSKNNDSDFKRYRIYRGTSPGATTQVDSVSIVGDTTKSVSAPIPGVTFYFRVRTLDSANNLSAYSGELSASSLDQTPPSAITGLSTTAADTTVILRWHQSTATDFGKYYIYMDTVALPATAVDSALTKADTARTFTHLTNGKTYYFRVTAADTFANVSAFSSVASATPFDQTSPSAPQNLAAVASNASVVLHWDANTENDLLRYRVFVGTSSGNQVQTDSTVHDSIVVNGLNSNTEYFFRIAAIDTGKNQSNYSNEVSATPFAANAAPTNPVLLAATAQNQSVVLTWQKNPDADILKYYVAAGLSSNPTALVDSTNGDTTVTLSGLTNEQAYYFRIIAVDSALQVSGYSNELSQSPYDNVAPATPVNFIASAGDQSAQLTWNNDNTEPIKIYRVFVNGTQADSLTDTTYTVTGLTNYTTYQVSIVAVDSNDNVSSNTSDIGVTPIDLTAPSIPNNLTAEASDASVHLVWSANTEGDLAWYRIYINDVQSDSTTDTSYTANALTNYTSYSFKIAAVDTSHNASALTSQVSVMPYDQTAPAIPQDLAATAGDGQVTLNWTANGEGDLARYRVYMDGTQIDSTTNNSYTKTGLTNYTTYNFKLSAVDTSRNASAPTSQVSVMPYDQTAPSEVTGLSVTRGDGALTLNWTANGESDFKAYRLFMGTSPNPTTQVDSVTTIATTSKEFGGLVNGTTYYYRMVAVDTSGNASDYSDEVSSSPYDQTAPAVPQDLAATAGDGQVTLSWTANGEDDLARYRVYMDGAQIDSTTNNSYTKNGLTNDVTYNFKIAAVDTGHNFSAFSTQVSGTPTDMTAPSKPTVLTAVAGNTSIVLTWRKNIESDVIRYRIYRGTTAAPTTQVDSTTSASDTTKTYGGLTNGTTYFFRITAVDGHGNFSVYSDDISVKPLDAPGSLTVSLFQNKAAKKYAQITVVSSKALSAVPTVTAKLGVNNTPVTMTAIASSNQQFRGGFVINSAGNYTLQTSAQTLNGRDTTVQRTFNAVIAKSGEAATLASTDGKASLKLNRATLAEEAVLLSEQSDDGVYTFSADAEANGSMILEIQFDAAQYADPSKLFIYRMEKETWSKQKTQVFTKTNTLKAQVESFGTYKIAYDGSFDGSNIVPTEFALLQNYPNPFNPSTTIRYDLREDETVSLKIYNMLGQEVRTLRKGFQMAGEYRVQWDGRNNAGQVVSSGVYIYRLETKSYRATKKMMFLK